MKRSLILVVVALVLCVSVSAAPRDAVMLGDRAVDFRAEHDRIDVGQYEGRFRSLYLEVEKNNVELFDMVVIYGDGQREKINTRLIFDEGTRSRMIRLEGGERRIRAIEFSYKTRGNWLEGRARIIVYGIK